MATKRRREAAETPPTQQDAAFDPGPAHKRSRSDDNSDVNWALLPYDVLLVVFDKLQGCDVLLGGGSVCRSWHEK